MTVYVLYAEYGADENCSAPEGATLHLSEAEGWVARCPEQNAYTEFEIAGTFWELPA